MKTDRDLERQLAAIDRRGYPAYKGIHGAYDFGDFELSVDHVQGDPFAAPSRLSVRVAGTVAGLPPSCLRSACRRIAVEDLLVRRFAAEASRASRAARGSGRSGYVGTSAPGPEVLARSACEVAIDGGVVLRFEAGLPAHGRTIDGRAAAVMLLDAIPGCVRRALILDGGGRDRARAAADLADDQHAVRRALEERGLVAFVADGAILPRESGVSARPLAGARPFASPASMRVALDLPHRGRVTGMGIRRGITLVVGGGYHGKSTLLKALQEGVYDHVAGDGRELVITDATAVKLRAEDGRAVHAVDISPFIDNLPDGRATTSFDTADASGSTSQAAGTIEALEAGARVLLIDEDTSATNFMVRDELMEAVVAADREPITPFAERVRDLWERCGVSCVLVVGSTGAFFPVADSIVQMDAYAAQDITDRVREVLVRRGAAKASTAAPRRAEGGGDASPRQVKMALRAVQRDASGRRGERGRGGSGRTRREHLKVRARGLEGFTVGSAADDLRLVEQLVDEEQVAALAQMVRLVLEGNLLDGSRTMPEAVRSVFDELEERGWKALAPRGGAVSGWALPRPQELFAALNRLRL